MRPAAEGVIHGPELASMKAYRTYTHVTAILVGPRHTRERYSVLIQFECFRSDEVHVRGLDVVDEHREVIERRAQQVEQAAHEDIDAHRAQRIAGCTRRAHTHLLLTHAILVLVDVQHRKEGSSTGDGTDTPPKWGRYPPN